MKSLIYLLTRDQQVQRHINTLRVRLENLATESSKRLDQSRRETETRFSQELKAALEVYRPLRILGTCALLVGLACVTYANFID